MFSCLFNKTKRGIDLSFKFFIDYLTIGFFGHLIKMFKNLLKNNRIQAKTEDKLALDILEGSETKVLVTKNQPHLFQGPFKRLKGLKKLNS